MSDSVTLEKDATSTSSGVDVSALSNSQLIKLLAALRGSSVPNPERGELRDLILNYSQAEEGEKEAVALKLGHLLTKHQDQFTAILGKSQKSDSKNDSSNSKESMAREDAGATWQRVRPQPQFSKQVETKKEKPTETEDNSKDQKETESQETKSETASPADSTDEKPKASKSESLDDSTKTPSQTTEDQSGEIEEETKPKTATEVQETEDRSGQSQEAESTSPASKEDEAPAETEVPEKEEPTTPEAPQPEAAKPEETTNATVGSGSYKERINEIKHTINEKYGSPVNIIELNPEIGREYMGALLDAMKQSAGGGSIRSAMDRLEKAYKAVENLDQTSTEQSTSTEETNDDDKEQNSEPQETQGDTKQEKETTSEKPEPESNPASEQETKAEVSKEKKKLRVKQPDGETKDDNQSGFDTTQTKRKTREEASIPLQDIPESSSFDQNEEAPRVNPNLGGAKAQTKSENPEANPEPEEKAEPELAESEAKQEVAKNGEAVNDNQGSKLSSIADSGKPLPKLEDLPTKEEVEESKKNDYSGPEAELHSKEVNDALRQLLSEWSLFKKSGWFGTGPNGIEHPLYLKLKDLPMAAVIAGRFEGANKTIKQNISDYMNGWRYEYNVVHELEETFEHYLRRVLKEILEYQEKTEHNL